MKVESGNLGSCQLYFLTCTGVQVHGRAGFLQNIEIHIQIVSFPYILFQVHFLPLDT